jgi:acrylyl-CoA reductase (NADPH)
VFPFILRGVNLLGIDSNTATYEQRCKAWKRLVTDLPRHAQNLILSGIIHLDQVPAMGTEMLDGRVRGRIVVDVTATTDGR